MADNDIQGTVTDADGNAVGGAVVALWSQDSPNEVVTTTADNNGNYIFETHPDDDGTTTNWHIAARDPNDGTRQFPSLHSVSAQVSFSIPDSGVARWTFYSADTDSGTALDVWNNNDGTISGATTGAPGANQTYTTNEAYSFDGTDDLVDVPNFGALSAYTFAVWVYPDTTGGDQSIIDTRTSNQLAVLRASGTDWELIHQDGNGNFQSVIAGTVETATWQFLAGTWDGSTLELYKNDTSLGTQSASGTNTGSKGTAIGAAGDNSSNFTGDIDDPRVYSKSLSDTEESNLYNTGSI